MVQIIGHVPIRESNFTSANVYGTQCVTKADGCQVAILWNIAVTETKFNDGQMFEPTFGTILYSRCSIVFYLIDI